MTAGPPLQAAPPEDRSTARGVVALGLVFLILAVYGQTGSFAFITLDDKDYVFANQHVVQGLTARNVAWAFRSLEAANWHPLTWLSHMADVEMFGLDAGWHHRVNVLLHAANTVLLFLVLERMSGGFWPSAFVAGLFGVHPLHVESVAWVAERKDLLSTLFWMLTLAAYLRYARRPGAWRYLPVAACLAAGLLSKPMLVTLPCVLLLLDWWPLGRTGPGPLSPKRVSRLVVEKIPLLLLSAASILVTLRAQAAGSAVVSLASIPIGERLSNAINSLVKYLGQMVWPASLAVFYPHPVTLHAAIPAWRLALSILLLCGLSLLALRQASRRPYLATGWLWYLGTLLPVIGLFQVGGQALADRYTYMPLTGIFIVAAWGLPDVLAGWRFRRRGLATAAAAVLVALAATAWNQTGYWRDSFSLFNHAIGVAENSAVAWTSLGAACFNAGRDREAIEKFREALRINPAFPEAWYGMAVVQRQLGDRQSAVTSYREALRAFPDFAAAWFGLCVASGELGRHEDAIASCREATRLLPDSADAWYALGAAYSRTGRPESAIESYRQVLRIRPDHVEVLNNIGVAYVKTGQPLQAIESYREALRHKPDDANVWFNLGVTYLAANQPDMVPGVADRLRLIDPARADALLAMARPPK